MVYKLHQCFENISIYAGNSNENCPLCKTKKKGDCCKTTFKIVKTDPAHHADLLKIDFLKYRALLPETVYLNPLFQKSLAYDSSVLINAPPNFRGVALFISHCNFRI